MKIFKRVQSIFFSLLIIFFYSCKKENYLTLEGTLLVSNTNPIPVTKYNIHFFQAGSPGIPIAMYNSPSSAFTTTDNRGHYSVKFKQGRSGFMIFQGANSGPIDMIGEGSGNFPGFIVQDIPANGGTIYLYKKIDNASLLLSTISTAISPADSIFITYNSSSGPVEKKLTGISVPANTNSFLLDNITNLALGHYDFAGRKYQNDIYIRLRKQGLPYPLSMFTAMIDTIGPGDVPTGQFLFYLQ
jgi:hypothetical protein